MCVPVVWTKVCGDVAVLSFGSLTGLLLDLDGVCVVSWVVCWVYAAAPSSLVVAVVVPVSVLDSVPGW